MLPVSELNRHLVRLATPLSQVKGVGPSVLKKLAKLSLHTVEDLLFTLPLRYDDRRIAYPLSSLRPGELCVTQGIVQSCRETVSPRSQRRMFEVLLTDGQTTLLLRWFHYRKDWFAGRFTPGRHLRVAGEVKLFSGRFEIHHPEVEATDSSSHFQGSSWFGKVLPVYPLTEGFNQHLARKIWGSVIDNFAGDLVSGIPAHIMARQRLLPLSEAVAALHKPPSASCAEELTGQGTALRTLKFDEFFFLQLGLALKQRESAIEPGVAMSVAHRYTRPLSQLLPFRLTAAQRRVLAEIKQDLSKPHPMNRLLQGDVGSGKTIVALMSALMVIENGYQVALVAPTEILAEQHLRSVTPWLQQLSLTAVMLTGSMTVKKRQETLNMIRNGEAHLIIGTHAALQDHVDYHRLGLGIIDEQHRFGVKQRGILKKKGINPHMLIMTATPIPRTLSLTSYGNLSISVIDELPPGRIPVTTKIFNERQRDRVYDLVLRQIEAGRQIYVVYPLIEESEQIDLHDASAGCVRLQNRFPGCRIALLHGKMSTADKDEIMVLFKNGQIDILVSTTVIEVGIDVANATVMIIEHADRFGLAQLHQLRGRVGRGGNSSYCMLFQPTQCSTDAKRRLRVMTETTDGFKIAEEDLQLRGPGEFLGTRQAGMPELRLANLCRDGEILEAARDEAFTLVSNPDFFHTPQFHATRVILRHRWANRLELADVG